MTLIELVVCLGALVILTLAGMTLLAHSLESQFNRGLDQREEAALKALETRLTRAWLRRAAHFYRKETWLVIEGESSDGGLTLRRLAITFTDEAGRHALWTLERREGQWRETVGPPSGDTPAGQSRLIGYAGDIVMDTAAGIWKGGEPPPALRLRFPAAREKRIRQGFAIPALW